MRGMVPAGLAAGAAVATALASSGPGALVPLKDAVVGAVEVSVAFVVDFGSAGVVSACVRVPAGDDGYDALALFTEQERELPATYNASGLLCSIDNVPDQNPAPACGEAVRGGYDYWSYWHGTTGTWVYAETGASAAVTDGDVEGWRYQNPGRGNPTDPPPRATADYRAICTSDTPAPAAPAVGSNAPGASGPAVSSHPVADGGPGAPRPVASSVPAATRPAEAAGASPGETRDGDRDRVTSLVVTAAIVAVLVAVATVRWRRHPPTP